MAELPNDDEHEVIHLGDQTAVVVPLAEYLVLREALRDRRLTEIEAEESAAVEEYQRDRAAGDWTGVPQSEARRRLGLPGE